MTKTIELSKPLKGHDGEIRQITFREPTYADMRKIGFEPVVFARGGADGNLLLVTEQNELIAQYIELLSGIPPEILAQMSCADTLKAKDIVTGFFTRAPAHGTSKPAA